MLTDLSKSSSLECKVCSTKPLNSLHFGTVEWGLCSHCLFLQRLSIPEDHSHLMLTEYDWGTRSTTFSDEKYPQEVSEKEKRWNMLQSLFPFTLHKPILDFGSGTGPFLDVLKQKNIPALGVEIDPVNSEYSRQRGHKVFTGDFLEMNFGVESISMVNMENSFFYVQKPAAFLEKMHRILEPEGILFWSERDYHRNARNVFINLSRGLQVSYLSKNAIRNLLVLHGFELIYYSNWFGNFTLIAKKTKEKQSMTGSYLLEFAILKTIKWNDWIWKSLHDTLVTVNSLFRR